MLLVCGGYVPGLLLRDELLVTIVRPNPEPNKALGVLPCEGTNAQPDASGPEIPYLLESQRRMPRIGLKHREAAVGQFASLSRELAIMEPALRRREMVHLGSGVQRPLS